MEIEKENLNFFKKKNVATISEKQTNEKFNNVKNSKKNNNFPTYSNKKCKNNLLLDFSIII